MTASLSSSTVAIVLGVSVVTLATRVGGYLVVRRVDPSERTERLLDALPGAVIAGVLAPELADGSPTTLCAATVTAIVAWRTGSVLGALFAVVPAALVAGAVLG